MPYGNQQMDNKGFPQCKINRHKSMHNKYIICSRETFSKSRLVFRDNFSWQKGQSNINYRCKKATYYSNNTSQLKQTFQSN